MTLEEKFEPYVIRYTQDDVVGYLESDNVPILEYQKQCEKIADEYAIGFAKYVLINHGKFKYVDLEKMLTVYKKEKGL